MDEIDKKALEKSLSDYYAKRGENYQDHVGKEPKFNNPSKPSNITEESGDQDIKMTPPNLNFQNPEQYQSMIEKETDPDLMVAHEIIPLPSKGLFYKNKLSEIKMEYLTTKDEDILTTPSLIENGTVLDIILKKKIKTPNVNVDDLLTGDKNALLLFLRASSYGEDYTVQVVDPRNGKPFEQTVDLTKLKYKELKKLPNENGEFSVFLPMRKKNVIFRLLTSGEEEMLYKRAESIKEAYNQEFSQLLTMKLKAHVVNIDGNTDRNYIDRFIDAMPLKDSNVLRKEILDVSPDVDMSYEFKANDGYKFKANLNVGVDFFFPNL